MSNTINLSKAVETSVIAEVSKIVDSSERLYNNLTTIHEFATDEQKDAIDSVLAILWKIVNDENNNPVLDLFHVQELFDAFDID